MNGIILPFFIYATARDRGGFIGLVTVLAVGILGLAAVAGAATGAIASLTKNAAAFSGESMFATSESAAREGARQFIGANAGFAGGAGALVNGAVTSDVTVTDAGWPYFIVRGRAADGRATRENAYRMTIFPEGMAFDYAVYSENALDMGGNATVNGNVYASTSISFTGASATVNGDAFSSNAISDTDNITGDAVVIADAIPPPQIDEGAYRDAAIAAGTYFADANDAEAYLNNQTRSAVVFVEDAGTTKIQGNNTNLMGSIVTMGPLEISGGTYTGTDPYAAVVVFNDLAIKGGATINGIVYTLGSTSFGSGTNTINGSLISAGGATLTDVTGNAVINFVASAVSGWQSLLGLTTTTSAPPRALGWSEE
ncbi:MAG: hypothetical protein AAB539_04530 [Patescibacteria group bacterium]